MRSTKSSSRSLGPGVRRWRHGWPGPRSWLRSRVSPSRRELKCDGSGVSERRQRLLDRGYRVLVLTPRLVAAVVPPIPDQTVQVTQLAAADDNVGYAVAHRLVEKYLLRRVCRRVEAKRGVRDG